MGFRAVVQEYIRQNGISQAEFARRVGAHPGLVSQWLRTSRPVVPGRDYCERIAQILGRPLGEILELVGHEPGSAPVASSPVSSSHRRMAEYVSEMAKKAIGRTPAEQVPEVLPKWQDLVAFYWKSAEPDPEAPPDPREHQTGDGFDNVKTVNLPGLALQSPWPILPGARQTPGMVNRELALSAA